MYTLITDIEVEDNRGRIMPLCQDVVVLTDDKDKAEEAVCWWAAEELPFRNAVVGGTTIAITEAEANEVPCWIDVDGNEVD